MATTIKEKDNKTSEKVETNKNNIINNLKHRDISIDLIRVIACLSVIATHVCLQVLNQCYNRIDWSRLLEKSFLTDGVPLFFMITGFFLVNGRSYLKIWKSTIVKILIPSLVFIIFTQAFFPFIVNKDTFMNCLINFNIGPAGIIKCLLKGDVSYINGLCSHLWYIFSYIKIVIWIPILWLVCKETNESKLARRIMMALTFLNFVIGDIQRFIPVSDIFPLTIFTIIPKEILYVLFGYELYVNKDKIKKNKKLCLISLIGFVIVNLLRYKIEIYYMVINSFVDIINRDSFMEWKYTSLNIFSGIFLFMFLYSFEIKNSKLSDILVWISDKTFGIYLVHYLVLAKIDLYKFEKLEKFIFEMIYLVLGTIIAFIISLCIVCVIKYIINFIKKLINDKSIAIKN